MYDYPPKKCPDCGVNVLHPSELRGQENWNKLATWIEVVNEGRDTIGYNVICNNCNKGVIFTPESEGIC